MKKKGQVTIFIIVAIVIIAILALYFLLIKPPKEIQGVYTDSIYNFVEECIQETAEDAIYEIGQNGGYYMPTSLSTRTGIAYYYADNKNLMPTQERVESQISAFIKENLFFCTKNFVQFTNYNVSQGKIDVDTTITKDKVNIKVNYPITLSQGEESSRIEDFEKDVEARLGLVYNSIAEVVNSSEYGICLSCLYDIAEENDFYVEMLDYDENTIIVIFIDRNSEINQEDFEYVYAIEV